VCEGRLLKEIKSFLWNLLTHIVYCFLPRIVVPAAREQECINISSHRLRIYAPIIICPDTARLLAISPI
jgi:hypothetical protein